MKLKRFLLFAILCNVTVGLFGADSTFSKDNEHVYLVQDEQQPPRPSGECSLIDINLGQNTCRAIDLRKTLGERVRNITLSNAGFVLCATKSAVWAYDPDKEHCVKVLGAPKAVELIGLGYDPAQEIILAAGRGSHGQELFCLPKNGDHWIPVYNRRCPSVDYPTFSDDGTLYFASRGDLWTGFVEKQTEPTAPALNAYPKARGNSAEWPKSISVAALVAYRCAPVAYLETQNTTPDSTGLHSLAVSKHFVYGDYSRLGGSGWGSLIRCKRPAPFKTENDQREIPAGSTTKGDPTVEILQSVEMVSEDVCFDLCASRDGSLVFYTTRGGKSFLIKDDGKPESLAISGLEDLF
jgi:hypothetical protein